MDLAQTVAYTQGRLDGLSGTVRFDLDDSLRLELKQLSELLSSALDKADETSEQRVVS